MQKVWTYGLNAMIRETGQEISSFGSTWPTGKAAVALFLGIVCPTPHHAPVHLTHFHFIVACLEKRTEHKLGITFTYHHRNLLCLKTRQRTASCSALSI
jgi:hypothetical protein